MDPLYPCVFFEEKKQTCRSSIDTPFHKPQRKLARMQVWTKTSITWPKTTSSMVLKCQMMVRKGSTRYIGTERPFSIVFAPPKSFLCRLDQTKSLQSISTPQQTFLPRFETLTMQIGLEKYKKQFMEAVWSGGGKFLFSNFSQKPRWICKQTWNHNSSLVLLGK